jgi:serine/threonine-protein kinase
MDPSVPPVSAADATDQDADQTRIQTEPPPDLSDPGLPKIAGYELYSVLGKGGMGVVYKARQTGLQRLVALKMVRNADQADLDDLKRFRTEAEAVARLQHPNIVQIYEIGNHHGLPYCALEYCGGGSLHAKLAGTPLLPTEAAQLAETLARAVAHAHEHGIVHRDLKPHNVLLSEDGEPKVTDFGLAKKLDAEGHQTTTGAVMGTPSYMAPEQAQGKATGPLVDVYALGAILYDLLTGRPPFKAATTVDTMLQVVAAEPVAPSSLNARVPRDLETICLKCLHKEPARRYASALELAEDLRRFQAGEPILARPVGQVERTWKWMRLHPAATALWAAVMVLALGLSAAAVWYTNEQADRELAEALHRAEGQHQLQLREEDRKREADRTTLRLEQVKREQALLRQEEKKHEAERTRTAVQGALKQAAELQAKALWRQARATLQHQLVLLGPSGDDQLRQDVETTLTRLALVEKLDRIRQDKMRIVGGFLNALAAPPAYAAAFSENGLDFKSGDEDILAAQLLASPLQQEFLAALDDWLIREPDAALKARLCRLTARVTGHAWRETLPAALLDRGKLEALLREVPAEEMTAALLAGLCEKLEKRGGNGVTHLEAAVLRHPTDFWPRYELAVAYYYRGKAFAAQAAAGFNACLALRPDSVAVWDFLGLSLHASGDLDRAIQAYREAFRVDPTYALPYNNLGRVLEDKGDATGAMEHYHQAIAKDPKFVAPHVNLGRVLHAKGDYDGAIAEYDEALRLNPKYAYAHNSRGVSLYARGDLNGAIAAWHQAVAFDPTYTIARANLGFGLRMRGALKESVDLLREAATAFPKDATIQQQLVFSERWLLFKERLPDVLAGKVVLSGTPAVEYAFFCQQSFMGHRALALKLYQEGFAADAKLLEQWPYRYNAACAAVLLAAGEDVTVAPLEKWAADLRTQARQWLLAELEAARKTLQANQPAARKLALERVARWKRDADLASVREEAALAQLPESERAAWRAIWADVERLLNPGLPRTD